MAILTIDVGGSYTKYGLIDDNLNFLDKGMVPSVTTNLDDFVEALGSIYDKFAGKCDGVALSMPGVINPKTGYFYTGGSFDHFIYELDFKSVLEKRIPIRLSFANDAKCAANAELGYGVLKDIDDAIVIVFGTAIGGCVIYNHKVVNGKHFIAGEFSYISTDYHATGFNDCWAERNGALGLLKNVKEELNTDKDFTGKEIFEMANDGDERVIKAIRRFAKEAAYQIYNLQNAFDPEVFAIGGGISAQPLLIKYIDESFDEIEKEYGYLTVRPKLVVCKYGNDANLIGALYNFKLNYPE